MDEKPNQFTNTIPKIFDGIGKICSVFAHRKEVDHSQIINALHESQRQYSLQLEKMNQFQKQMIEQGLIQLLIFLNILLIKIIIRKKLIFFPKNHIQHY